MNSEELQRRLADRATAAGIAIAPEIAGPLEAYFRLLSAWNQKMNLTALPLSDPSPAALDRLLIEPLVAAKHVPANARSVMDVGSGGGSPAIPFALAARLHLTMVESKARKVVFLREALRVAGLTGVAIAGRVEDLAGDDRRPGPQDIVTIRAVRPDATLLTAAVSFLSPAGRLFMFSTPAAPDVVHEQLRLLRTIPLTATSSIAVMFHVEH